MAGYLVDAGVNGCGGCLVPFASAPLHGTPPVWPGLVERRGQVPAASGKGAGDERNRTGNLGGGGRQRKGAVSGERGRGGSSAFPRAPEEGAGEPAAPRPGRKPAGPLS